jgi:hypothetical protein
VGGDRRRAPPRGLAPPRRPRPGAGTGPGVSSGSVPRAPCRLEAERPRADTRRDVTESLAPVLLVDDHELLAAAVPARLGEAS